MMHFAIFHLYNTPTFKTKALHLASKEERVKPPAVMQTDNTVLSFSSLAVTGSAFRY